MAQADIKIDHVLFCDDYREEKNGKGFVIGLYHEAIFFNAMPIDFTICVLLIGRVSKDFSASVEVKFVPTNDKKGTTHKGKFEGSINALRKDRQAIRFFMPIRTPALAINDEGTIIVRFRSASGKKWQKVGGIDVRKDPNLSSAQPQPS